MERQELWKYKSTIFIFISVVCPSLYLLYSLLGWTIPNLMAAVSGFGFSIFFYLVTRPVARAVDAKTRFLATCYVAAILVPFSFAAKYEGLSDSMACISGANTAWDRLYFSYVAFTTVGFGDLKPVETCRAVAAIEAVMGYVCLGLLVGSGFQLFASSTGKQIPERLCHNSMNREAIIGRRKRVDACSLRGKYNPSRKGPPHRIYKHMKERADV